MRGERLVEVHEFVDDSTLHAVLAMAARTEARRQFWAEHRREGLARVRAAKATSSKGGR